MEMKKALVVLSGGQDSTYCLVHALRTYSQVSTITFNYGQRHVREIEAAKTVAMLCGVAPYVLDVGPILQGTSPLTDAQQPLAQYENFDKMEAEVGSAVEKTFVPMRNALFLTLAANRAVVTDCNAIVTGVCQQDNANYPDCRESFIWAQQQAINQALGLVHPSGNLLPNAIRIDTPLMHATKAQAIQDMWETGDLWLLAFTHTSYDGLFPPTGKNHANILRAQGFLDADLPDPLVLRANMMGLMPLPPTENYNEDRTSFQRVSKRIRLTMDTFPHLAEA
jgi:7-cyano-7-deazaguanine synthase